MTHVMHYVAFRDYVEPSLGDPTAVRTYGLGVIEARPSPSYEQGCH